MQLILISLRTTLFRHVSFPNARDVPFRTIPFRTILPPFRHSTILPFHCSAIPPFRHSVILPFRHSAILPFRHSAIPPFRHIVQVESPMTRIHTCEFEHTNSYVIDQSCDFVLTTGYSSYLLHPLRFLAYLFNLYVDTCSCLHVCPSLAYYGESYFAQHIP